MKARTKICVGTQYLISLRWLQLKAQSTVNKPLTSRKNKKTGLDFAEEHVGGQRRTGPECTSTMRVNPKSVKDVCKGGSAMILWNVFCSKSWAYCTVTVPLLHGRFPLLQLSPSQRTILVQDNAVNKLWKSLQDNGPRSN